MQRELGSISIKSDLPPVNSKQLDEAANVIAAVTPR